MTLSSWCHRRTWWCWSSDAESCLGPCVLIGTEGEHMVGVATINGSIHLIHITYEGSCNLLKMAEQILADNILVTSV